MITIELVDEVNAIIRGLSPQERSEIYERTKEYQKGYFKTAAFKTGKWDGKVSNFNKNGLTFQYLIESKIANILIDLGYKDNDIEIEDLRPNHNLDVDTIDEEFLLEENGELLFDYQVEAVNQVIKHRHGIIDATTSAGKTFICESIVKVYDGLLPTLTIVPSMNLVYQTKEDYEKAVDVVAITDKLSTKKKQELLSTVNENGQHTICTWQTLNRNKELFEGFSGVVIVDEVHNFGDALSVFMREYANFAPVRVGLTGSIPKDREKRERIYCHIGGEPLIHITLEDVKERGIISNFHIYPVSILNKGIRDISNQSSKWDWDKEYDFLCNNKGRLETIAEYIETLDRKNTLILCHGQQAQSLSEILGYPYIDKDVKIEERQYYYDFFKENDDFYLVASYGTSSTGLSINRIFRLVLIDVGKDFTKIVQGIGRGLRKDGEIDYVDILDIYSDTKYSKKHLADRKRIYKQNGYMFEETPYQIEFGTVVDE